MIENVTSHDNGSIARPRRIVVAGGGVAGCRCAFELRARGFDGAVTLVSAEAEPPYDRTLLSKAMLAELPRELGGLRAREAYADRAIELRLGTPAGRLDARRRSIRLVDGEDLPYDRLIVCTGGRPVLPAALACPGVLTLRDVSDLGPLRDALDACRSRLVVVGGGFIGGEIASSARARGIDVTIVEAAGAPLMPVLGEAVAHRVAELHREAGVELRCGSAAAGIRQDGSEYVVGLEDGSRVSGDAVVVGVGMSPRLDWLRGGPLRLDGGVLTDAGCQTGVPGVLAAGDCARWWHPGYGARLRVEHWDTAARHGIAAARNALGHRESFAPVPFFWSDQHGVKLQWVGYAPAWDSVELRDGADGAFMARYLLDERLVGLLAAGHPREIARARLDLQTEPGAAVEPTTSFEEARTT